MVGATTDTKPHLSTVGRATFVAIGIASSVKAENTFTLSSRRRRRGYTKKG